MVEYPWRCYYFMSMPEVSRSRTSLEHNMSVFVLRRMALRVVAVGVLSLMWSALTVVAQFTPASAPGPGQ